jgi:hypothetical protein
MTSPEIDGDRDIAPAIQLVEHDDVVGHLPVEVLVEQLEHVVSMNNDLRLMLKEARYEIRQLRGEVTNYQVACRAAEDTTKIVQATSEARHLEILRLSEHVRQIESQLRSLQANPVVKGLRRYHAARRALSKLRG